MIPFGEWLPDLPDYENPGVTVARNVVSGILGSYKPLGSLAAISDALDNRAQGAGAAEDDANAFYFFAGDVAKLYSLASGVFADVSKVATTYTTPATGGWEFQQWGNTIIATNFTEDVQVITLGGANFADLAGSPPKAKHIAIVGDFVVLGNLDTGSPLPRRLHWSPFNDPTASWTPNPTTQAGRQDFPDGGAISRIIGGEYGTVFQENAIRRMTYVGFPFIFQFDKIEKNRGTKSPGSVIDIGTDIYYLGQDSFYKFNGSYSVPISANKVSKTFFADFDQDYPDRVTAAIDPINTNIIWSYPGVGNVSGTPNKLIIYNWTAKRWTDAEVITEMITNHVSPGVTLEGLDAVSTDIDALPASLDSNLWKGGSRLLTAFNSSHILASFTGIPLDATLETAERMFTPGERTFIAGIRPIVEEGTVTVQVAKKGTLEDAFVWSVASSRGVNGECPVRSNGRYHKIRVNISGNFKYAKGIDITGTKVGKR